MKKTGSKEKIEEILDKLSSDEVEDMSDTEFDSLWNGLKKLVPNSTGKNEGTMGFIKSFQILNEPKQNKPPYYINGKRYSDVKQAGGKLVELLCNELKIDMPEDIQFIET